MLMGAGFPSAVNASAGNDGPGASTANHASPWVTTVAASSTPLTRPAPASEPPPWTR